MYMGLMMLNLLAGARHGSVHRADAESRNRPGHDRPAGSLDGQDARRRLFRPFRTYGADN